MILHSLAPEFGTFRKTLGSNFPKNIFRMNKFSSWSRLSEFMKFLLNIHVDKFLSLSCKEGNNCSCPEPKPLDYVWNKWNINILYIRNKSCIQLYSGNIHGSGIWTTWNKTDLLRYFRAKPPCQEQTITHFLAGLFKNITNIDANIGTNIDTKLYPISNTFSCRPGQARDPLCARQKGFTQLISPSFLSHWQSSLSSWLSFTSPTLFVNITLKLPDRFLIIRI